MPIGQVILLYAYACTGIVEPFAIPVWSPTFFGATSIMKSAWENIQGSFDWRHEPFNFECLGSTTWQRSSNRHAQSRLKYGTGASTQSIRHNQAPEAAILL